MIWVRIDAGICGRPKNRLKIENYGGEKCVGLGETIEVHLIVYIKMTTVIRSTHVMIFGVNHPRIRVPPTQFQKIIENLEIEFSGN